MGSGNFGTLFLSMQAPKASTCLAIRARDSYLVLGLRVSRAEPLRSM